MQILFRKYFSALFLCLQTQLQMGIYIKSYLKVLTALVIENWLELAFLRV